MKRTKYLLIEILSLLAAVATLVSAKPSSQLRKQGLKFTQASFGLLLMGMSPMVAGAAEGARFSENNHIVYALKPGDHQAGANFDSINMGLLESVCFILQFATLTGDAVLTFKSGATDATQTTSETFRYRLADAAQAAAGGDLYGAWVSASTLTLTAATYTDKTLIVEVDAKAMTDGQPFLTGAFSAAADALNASVVAIGRPKYLAHDMPSVIPA